MLLLKERATTAMSTNGRVLIVEDDPDIREMVAEYLGGQGYEVDQAESGSDMRETIERHLPDVVLLDVRLPGEDGLTLARYLRERYDVGIIMVTAANGVVDRVVGLEIGADDYVTKPFSPRELVARVRVVLRRGQGGGIPASTKAFEHDAEGHRIRYRGHLLDLTRYEYGLLAALLQRPGAVLSRSQLMDRVWGDALESGDRTIDTHIKTLRAKLRVVAPDEDPIRTHRGLGYSLEI
jgi:two-component system, OmpR family, catabolic regulation response regulator CreB